MMRMKAQPQLQQQMASLHMDRAMAAVAMAVVVAMEAVVAVGSMVEAAEAKPEAEEKKEKESNTTAPTA